MAADSPWAPRSPRSRWWWRPVAITLPLWGWAVLGLVVLLPAPWFVPLIAVAAVVTFDRIA